MSDIDRRLEIEHLCLRDTPNDQLWMGYAWEAYAENPRVGPWVASYSRKNVRTKARTAFNDLHRTKESGSEMQQLRRLLAEHHVYVHPSAAEPGCPSCAALRSEEQQPAEERGSCFAPHCPRRPLWRDRFGWRWCWRHTLREKFGV